MEENNEIYREPKYTLRWLGLQTLFVLGMSVVLALIASAVDDFALQRQHYNFLPTECYEFLSESISYCFAIISVTSISLMLVEVAFRKGINYLQYGLIGCALFLFYLLLLAMSEKMSFWIAYTIVSVMTIVLIGSFVMGITKKKNAALLSTAILAVEYGLILLLIYMDAMYFTLKLKVEDEELVLK